MLLVLQIKTRLLACRLGHKWLETVADARVPILLRREQ